MAAHGRAAIGTTRRAPLSAALILGLLLASIPAMPAASAAAGFKELQEHLYERYEVELFGFIESSGRGQSGPPGGPAGFHQR
ncbi:MAG: hypothetical protein U5J62_12040 [Desulfurivibrio sp.]|nr:hypothetical protein [Desulfurivibrio sp.]